MPSAIALDERTEAILAYEMNGEPLPRDHGYPVRAIIPGVVGARNIKWLGHVHLANQESDSRWQKRDYKAFSPSVDMDSLDWSTAPPMQGMPVQSAICWPADGESVSLADNATLRDVRGYAYSGAGAQVVRVDVSADKGKTWHTACLLYTSPSPRDRG